MLEMGSNPTFYTFASHIPETGDDQNFTFLPIGAWIPAERQVNLAEAFCLNSNSAKDGTHTPVRSEPPSPTDNLMFELCCIWIPEPSTIALGILGFGALLVFRPRR